MLDKQENNRLGMALKLKHSWPSQLETWVQSRTHVKKQIRMTTVGNPVLGGQRPQWETPPRNAQGRVIKVPLTCAHACVNLHEHCTHALHGFCPLLCSPNWLLNWELLSQCLWVWKGRQHGQFHLWEQTALHLCLAPQFDSDGLSLLQFGLFNLSWIPFGDH